MGGGFGTGGKCYRQVVVYMATALVCSGGQQLSSRGSAAAAAACSAPTGPNPQPPTTNARYQLVSRCLDGKIQWAGGVLQAGRCVKVDTAAALLCSGGQQLSSRRCSSRSSSSRGVLSTNWAQPAVSSSKQSAAASSQQPQALFPGVSQSFWWRVMPAPL